MQSRIIAYYDYIQSFESGVDENTARDLIPLSLKYSTAENLYYDITANLELLQGCEDVFIREFVLILKRVMHPPQHVICHRGEAGIHLYYLLQGRVQVLGDREEVLEDMDDGKFIGQASFYNADRRMATILTTNYCQMLLVDRDDFGALLYHYPENKPIVEQNAIAQRKFLEDASNTMKKNLQNQKFKAMMMSNDTEITSKSLVIKPATKFRLRWSLICLLFLLYNSITIPFRISFLVVPANADSVPKVK